MANRKGPSRATLYGLASVLAGMGLLGWRASQYGSWVVDDAGITFAYARSFAEGLGPVVAPGAAHVEGFSNPTWTALLALARLAGLFDHGTLFGMPDYVLVPKALALVCCGGILAACHRAASKVTRLPWLATLVVAALLTWTPSFVIWCFSGLENSLLALLVVCLAVAVFRAVLDDRLLTTKVAVLAGVLAAFAGLTRPDGLIYAAVYPLVVLLHLTKPTLRPSVRHVLVSVLAFAVPFGAYLSWRYLEFGRLVANTAVAKVQSLPDLQTFARPGDLVSYAGALAVVAFALVVGVALARAPWRAGLAALLVPLGLAVVAYAVLNPDWMAQFRFATPVWVLAALIGTLATAEVLKSARVRGRILVSVALVAVLLPSGAVLADAATKFQNRPTIPLCYIADRFGRVFNAYADILGLGRASVLMPDLGGSSLTSRLDIVDMAGLVDAKIADLFHDQDMAGLRDYVFETVKPTFLHSRGPWRAATGITSDPRLARDYTPIFRYAPGDGPVGDGDWVRKDAVSSPEKLAAARSYAAATVLRVERGETGDPLKRCGSVLRPGQTDLDTP
ncbi:hypothetical protein QMK34_39810 [Amycolatopsis sp. H20-H5]|nr:hypothetical protein [Amycolatopsis sp. H20-H5]